MCVFVFSPAVAESGDVVEKLCLQIKTVFTAGSTRHRNICVLGSMCLCVCWNLKPLLIKLDRFRLRRVGFNKSYVVAINSFSILFQCHLHPCFINVKVFFYIPSALQQRLQY